VRVVRAANDFHLPSLLVAVGLALVLATAAVGTPADPDLWGHITFGQDIINTGHLIQVDRHSFTDDRPWVNHEWLTEVVFAETYRLGGSPGLIVLKLLLIGGLLTLVWRHLTPLRPPLAVTVAIVTLTFVGTYWRTHTVRPQLFSLLCFAILLIAMVRADQGRRRWLLVLPALLALWVNLHGGWIVGLGVLGLWTAARIAQTQISWNERAGLALVGMACVAATLLNPYGIHMWQFLGETVRLGRADIEEWGSVLTYPVSLGLPWALVLTCAALAIWRAPGTRRWLYVAVVGLLAAASFQVSRLDAFFTLAVVILLAPELVALATSFRHPSRVLPRTAAAPAVSMRGVIAITVVTVVAMMIPAVKMIEPHTTCLPIGGPWIPDTEAGRFIQANQLKGRMLTWFDWGEYAIWHFGPALQVSMDGRRETVYSDATIQAHRRFYAGDATALPYVGQLSPDYIWLPTRLPITNKLGEAGWTQVFTSAVSIVFARDGAESFQSPAQSTTQSTTMTSADRRCFPGP